VNAKKREERERLQEINDLKNKIADYQLNYIHKNDADAMIQRIVELGHGKLAGGEMNELYEENSTLVDEMDDGSING